MAGTGADLPIALLATFDRVCPIAVIIERRSKGLNSVVVAIRSGAPKRPTAPTSCRYLQA